MTGMKDEMNSQEKHKQVIGMFFLPRFSSWYSGYFFYTFCNNKLWLYNTCMCQILGFYAELLKTKSFWLEQYCDVTQKTCSE